MLCMYVVTAPRYGSNLFTMARACFLVPVGANRDVAGLCL